MELLSETQIADFLLDLRDMSKNTIAAYRTGLELFAKWCIPLNRECLNTFDGRLVKAKYKRSGALQPYSTATRGGYIAALRKCLNWLAVRDLIPRELPAEADQVLKASRKSRKARVWMPREADHDLLRVASFYQNTPLPDDDTEHQLIVLRNRALIFTLYDTAGRISEVLQLKRAQVQAGAVDTATVIGKGNKVRTLFFRDESKAAIRAYCNARIDTGEWLFTGHRKNEGGKMTRQQAWRVVKHAARELGLKGFASPHAFRHKKAFDLHDDGMPLEGVQHTLGHSNAQTTQGYAKMSNARLRRMLDEYSKPAVER